MTARARSAGHPAPHRHKASAVGQLAGLAIGPAAWAIQLETAYALAGYACQPHGVVLSAFAAGWGWARGAGLALNLAAFAACLIGGAWSLRAWREVRDEAQGRARHAVETGEGRTRFLSLCGALTSFSFALAVAFETVMLLGAPACRA
jgi:hypothetical protein